MNKENMQTTKWTQYLLLFLGAYLIATSFSFDYKQSALCLNDLICGFLLLLFGARVLFANCPYAAWGACFVGIWLQMAPLFLWAESFIYLNDTLVGIIAIGCSVLIPTLSQDSYTDAGDIPPGWNYNPSSWPRRLPIIILAFIGYCAARYMAAYQLGYRDSVWDPIFEDGTLNVIASDLSRSFPISDAGLGAVCYLLEVLMGCKGSKRRWYTMPWIVVLFAFLVIPLGFVSILLIMLQPIIVGSWCSWCLLTAICMLVMIALTIDEMAAVWQYLKQARRENRSLWHHFWMGGPLEKLQTEPPHHGWKEAMRGVSVPWTLLVSTLLGVAVLFDVENLGINGLAADSNHVVGALCVTFSVIAMAEVVRSWRYVNVLFGAYFLISPWILNGFSTLGILTTMAAGLLFIVLALPEGVRKESYGK